MARNIVLLPSIDKLLDLNEALVQMYALTNDPALTAKLDAAIDLVEELQTEWQALNLSGMHNSRAVMEIARRIEVLEQIKARLLEG